VLGSVRRLVAVKGRKVLEFDLGATALDDPELLKAVIGPSGNLRAPTLVRGRTAVVGFGEAVYADELGP
jgi:hypothetical protein